MDGIYSRCVCEAQVSDPVVRAHHTLLWGTQVPSILTASWSCPGYSLSHSGVRGGDWEQCPATQIVLGNRAYMLVTCFRKPLCYPPLCGQFRGPITDKETSWFSFGVLCLSDLWEEVLETGISLLLLFPTENPFSALEQRSLFSHVSVVCSQQLTMMLIDLWACRSHIEKS